MRKRKSGKNPEIEETLHDNWRGDLKVLEVPLDNRPLIVLGSLIILSALVIAGRVLFLSFEHGDVYAARAEENSNKVERLMAPRGIIFDRYGEALVENIPVFIATLKVDQFFRHPELQDQTLETIERVLHIPSSGVFDMLKGKNPDQWGGTVVLYQDLNQNQLVQLKGAALPTIGIFAGFKRNYIDGPFFSSIVGYTGLASIEDLKRNPELAGDDSVGKTGLESYYDSRLRGTPGIVVVLRDARGAVFEEKERNAPRMGESLHLTVDGEFQRYFYRRLRDGLRSLGRTTGVGLALDPQTGEVLALVNLPSYDSNLFSAPGRNDEKRALLVNPQRPLFSRAVGGLYSPGSTIKPLVAVAALAEGVITPDTTIFSPGYLDVPNPYDPEKPTRFLDWRYQGDVNVRSALAQSSNVYFYVVGGGFDRERGLGISRLRAWWERFRLGEFTGIDLPGEVSGRLPTPEDKEKRTGTPWLLGDTYNVSIGQGDLLVTPIQLLNYIAAIGNGGKILRPHIVKQPNEPEVRADLSSFGAHIKEAKEGMVLGTKSPLGTGYLLHDLPFTVAAKTGTAQIRNNEQENAFFTGFTPAEKPKIAILILVERSAEGSLNTVPIARDVLEWYYTHRIAGKR